MIFKINLSVIISIFLVTVIVVALAGCNGEKNNNQDIQTEDTVAIKPTISDNPDTLSGNVRPEGTEKGTSIKNVQPDSLVAFAKTLVGIPYLYASTDPRKGFDCSGFITYVFNHFNIVVPRSSVDFTDFGKEIAMKMAKPGDLILFTGTDSTIRIVGHMGIVESKNNDTFRFIHSTYCKGNGVVIYAIGDYYKKRVVKLIRVFSDDSFK